MSKWVVSDMARASETLLRAHENRGKARQQGAGRAAVGIPQAGCNAVAGPFPGFPEGLGLQASTRGVADLAKAPGLGGGPRLAITGLEAQRGYVKVFHSLYCPGCHNLPVY